MNNLERKTSNPCLMHSTSRSEMKVEMKVEVKMPSAKIINVIKTINQLSDQKENISNKDLVVKINHLILDGYELQRIQLFPPEDSQYTKLRGIMF